MRGTFLKIIKIILKKKSLLNQIEFIDVHNDFRADQYRQKIDSVCHETSESKKFTYGYKCMCNFWFSGFIKYHGDVDYIIRLDEDCFILQFNIDKTIVDMEMSQVYYKTGILEQDLPSVLNGYEEFLENFYKKYNIHPYWNYDDIYKRNPYTNFFIMKPNRYFNDPNAKNFINEVNNSGCIFISRWGDLTLWGTLLRISGEKIDNIVDSDIIYTHGSHKLVVNGINSNNMLNELQSYSFDLLHRILLKLGIE